MSLVLPGFSPVLPGSPSIVTGTPRLVAGAPSHSEGRQGCSSRIWYCPEIDAWKFTLHILWDTTGGLEWLKFIWVRLWNATGGMYYSVRRYEVPSKPSEPSGTPRCFWWKLELLLMIVSQERRDSIDMGKAANTLWSEQGEIAARWAWPGIRRVG